ncbi:UGSC family (seleno)protein [Thermodesulfobacteriota bacterium]
MTQQFASLVKMYAKLVGKPNLPVACVPHPISRVPAQKCREYIESNDPVTGMPVIDEIVEALTKPLTEEEKRSRLEERPVPRFLEPDTEENLQRYFLENGMTDYLPVVLPTEERVEEMLKGTSHKPDEVVGDIRSAYEAWSFTVEKVAANAVMAGAKPEYMPVILAMAASGVAAISTSTQSFTTTIAINGPIRNEIGMNSGIGAMSPFNQANAVIGRVATLMSISLGGGRPGDTYWGSQGNPFDYNHATFAENEEALPPGWKPFHVQKGFKPEESAVSFFRSYSLWHWKNTYAFEKHKAILQMASWVVPTLGKNNMADICGFSLLLDPIVADDLVREGFPTKESLTQYIYENAQLSLEEFWQYHLVENTRRAAQKGVEPHATRLKQPQDTLINRFKSPDGINILVVGGRTNDFWQAGDWSHMGSFSIDDWR